VLLTMNKGDKSDDVLSLSKAIY